MGMREKKVEASKQTIPEPERIIYVDTYTQMYERRSPFIHEKKVIRYPPPFSPRTHCFVFSISTPLILVYIQCLCMCNVNWA